MDVNKTAYYNQLIELYNINCFPLYGTTLYRLTNLFIYY
jgi:hypothetical protein